MKVSELIQLLMETDPEATVKVEFHEDNVSEAGTQLGDISLHEIEQVNDLDNRVVIVIAEE